MSALKIGNPVWLRHDDATGGLNLMVSPESLCNEDGCSSNPSTRSTRSSSSIDFAPESDGTPAPSTNGIPTSLSISLEEQLEEQQRHHPHSDTKASSQDQPRRYKDIWSTMKAVAHAGIDHRFAAEGNAKSNKLGSSAGVEPNWPSDGSGNHVLGQCKPCAFFHSPPGCQTGRECNFCHLCPPREVQRRKRIRRRIARQQEEIDQKQQLAMRVAAHPPTAYAAWLGGSYLGYADAAALPRWPLAIYDKIL